MPAEQPSNDNSQEIKQIKENVNEAKTDLADKGATQHANQAAALVEIDKQEQKATLDDNINTGEGRNLIMEKIKSGDIAPDVFGERYAQQTGVEKLPDQTQTNLNTMFADLKGTNGAQKMLMAQRGMGIMLERTAQAIEAKKTAPTQ